MHKLANNEQLKVAQNSGIGIDLETSFISQGQDNYLLPQVLAAIGLADDVGLISNTVLGLRALLQLSEEYCYKYHVKQVPDKTKLLVFFPKSTSSVTDLELSTNCLKLGGMRVLPSIKATHVGLVWSPDGNGYAIADWLTIGS